MLGNALIDTYIIGPRSKKTCLRGFRQSEIQTNRSSDPVYVYWVRDRSKFTYKTFQKANNKGADQTARMRRLVCACVVRNAPKTGFLATGKRIPTSLALVKTSYRTSPSVHPRISNPRQQQCNDQ